MTTVPTRSLVPSIARPPAPPQGPARAAAEVGLTGKDVVRIIRKRKLLIILSVVIAAVLAAIVTILWSIYAPLYTADALVAHRQARTAGGLIPEAYAPRGDVTDRQLATTCQMARGRPVMTAAIQEEGRDLRNTDWYKDDKDTAVRRLQEEISANPVPKTNLVRISITGRDKGELAIIVNAVMDAMVKQKNKQATKDVNAKITRLEGERKRVLKLLIEKREEAAGSKTVDRRPEPGQIAEKDAQVAANMAKLRTVEAEISRLSLFLAQANSALNAVEGMPDEELAKIPDVQIPVQSDPILQGLRNRRITLEAERENAERRLGPNHPTVKDLQRRIEGIDRQIGQRAGELTAIQIAMLRYERERMPKSITAQLVTLTTERDRLETEISDFVKEREALRVKVGADDEGRRQADRDVVALQEEKNRVERRLRELRLEKDELAVLSVERMAFEPDVPSWPKWSVLMPLGVMVGLIVGLGLAFLLELVDTSIKNPADVSRRVDLPLLGMVPHSEDLDDEIEDMRLAFMSAPNSIVTEAYRQIRTTLLFSGPAAERKSLLVTSPLPGDGRTTVSMNLAGCIARSGHKVLIVDANFRQPTITGLFPQAPDGGFSSALVGQVGWREQVHEVEENLYVLGAGPLPPNPAELLGSEQMRKLVEEMKAEYDQVIFDGAPCVVLTDSSVLSTQVDGVILVVRAGANTYGIVQRSRDIMDRVGAHLIGVVLNGVRVTAGGYLRKNYETYYQYHQQPQLTAAEVPEEASQ